MFRSYSANIKIYDMQNAYFENIEKEIIKQVRQAKYTVRIAMAWFTNSSFYNELIQLMDKGINIELVLLDDIINWQPYAPDFNEINKHQNGCVRIAYRDKGFMHHKFCIIDSNIVISGSYNWTYYAEYRNIENVIITDDNVLIEAYIDQFKHLQRYYEKADYCPRYTREDIEQMERVDFEMLNTENRLICEIQKLSYCPVYETHTTVKIIQKRHNPIAAFNIGVNAAEGNEKEVLGVIIPKGQSLPCTLSQEFKAYADERDHLTCDILYGTSRNANLNTRLKTRPIKDITEGCTSDEFTIQIEMSLNTNGYLLVEICCTETGKVIQLAATNSDLVTYEKE